MAKYPGWQNARPNLVSATTQKVQVGLVDLRRNEDETTSL